MSGGLRTGAIAIAAIVIAGSLASSANEPQLTQRNFRRIAPQGLGDPQNSFAWAMAWWRGKLYVGTNRNWRCVESATWHRGLPQFFGYPPRDPDLDCPALADLPASLAAEIWRFTPGTNRWEMLFRSPVNVPDPEQPGRFVPRDIAFRGMSVWTEPGGTEVLFVSGMNAKPLFGLGVSLPPPRLLFSTDGETFEAVMPPPDSALADVGGNGFRGQLTFGNRFYLIASTVRGDGVILESEDPRAGDFRQVSPDDVTIFEIESFDGRLYAGVTDLFRGFSVVRLDTTASPPYPFEVIVPTGAYKPDRINSDVLSMFVFRKRLFIGGNGVPCSSAAEMLRISPDGVWDIVHGPPRQTPTGWMYPISGLDGGFSSTFNQHMWRMAAFDGRLFVGTNDVSTAWRNVRGLQQVLRPLLGFDLYSTADGWYYTPVTTTGFGDPFSIGARTIVPSPVGLFVGSANPWKGLQVYRGAGRSDSLAAPERLEVEMVGGKPLLSWTAVPGARQYRVLRTTIRIASLPAVPFPVSQPADGTPAVSGAPVTPLSEECPVLERVEQRFPGEFAQVGLATTTVFADSTAAPGTGYQYMVLSDNLTGGISGPSNMVQSPSLFPRQTFSGLDFVVAAYTRRDLFTGPAAAEATQLTIDEARVQAAGGNLLGASTLLRTLLAPAAPPLVDWAQEDFEILVAKLIRRVNLAAAGVIDPSTLD